MEGAVSKQDSGQLCQLAHVPPQLYSMMVSYNGQARQLASVPHSVLQGKKESASRQNL